MKIEVVRAIERNNGLLIKERRLRVQKAKYHRNDNANSINNENRGDKV